jgi:23S rRNA-/tRNA-specific pseudouridylate synthase
VLLRDALFLLVDKPAGLLSVPGRGGAASAAALLAAWHAAADGGGGGGGGATAAPPSSLFRSAAPAGLLGGDGAPRVVHRLDEATSGLMLFPTSRAALSAVAVLFVQRRVRKRYEAVLDTRAGGGALDAGEGLVDTPLGPNSHVSIVQTWHSGDGAADAGAAIGGGGGGGGRSTGGGGGSGGEGGAAAAPAASAVAGGRFGLKAAHTRWRVLERGAGAARVELEPLTGRTHQLRLHCALPPPLGLGCPVVGDKFYGDPRLCVESYQEQLTGRAPPVDGAGSVAALLRALDARRRALAVADDMPRLASCALLGAGGGGVRPAPRMLLHARELLIPDDFGGAWRAGLGLGDAGSCDDVEEGEDEDGAEELLLAAAPPLAHLRGDAAEEDSVAAAPHSLRVSARVERWPRFGFKNAATRRPAPRRVLRFCAPAPF